MNKAVPNAQVAVLLSSHPLFLSDFQSLLAGNFEVQSQRLQPTIGTGSDFISLDPADVYVMDSFPLPYQTESMLAHILPANPDARLLVLGDSFSDEGAFALLRRGAKGLLTYGEARELLPRAAQAVASGGFWVPRTLLSKFVDQLLGRKQRKPMLKGFGDLSPRENQVVACLLENMSNKEIATRLKITERTTKFHVSNVLAKYGVQRRADLIVLCYQQPPAAAQISKARLVMPPR